MSVTKAEIIVNTQDQMTLVKATHAANFLAHDLQELVKSANPLLSDIALEVLQQAVQIEQRLNRIEAITRPEEKIV